MAACSAPRSSAATAPRQDSGRSHARPPQSLASQWESRRGRPQGLGVWRSVPRRSTGAVRQDGPRRCHCSRWMEEQGVDQAAMLLQARVPRLRRVECRHLSLSSPLASASSSRRLGTRTCPSRTLPTLSEPNWSESTWKLIVAALSPRHSKMH